MAESGKGLPIDLKKLVTKEELKDGLRDVVRRRDLKKLVTKQDLHESPGLRRWLNAN